MRTLAIAIVAGAGVTASTAQRRVGDDTVTDLGDGGNVHAILAINSAASMLSRKCSWWVVIPR